MTNRTEIQQVRDSSCADSFQLSKPSRKPWRFTKLQFIDKVVDISVNMQKLTPTVQVPHAQQKDKLAHHRAEVCHKARSKAAETAAGVKTDPQNSQPWVAPTCKRERQESSAHVKGSNV